MRLGRKYKLLFEVDSPDEETNAIEISTPLTLEFDVTRNTSSSLNSATFRVYNLNETNRSLIFQNRTSIKDASGNRKRIQLQAGYNSLSNIVNKEGDLATIFTGDLLEAYSYRQGPDVITYINALDGGFGAYNSTISTTVEKGSTFKDVITRLTSSLKGVETGVIGETPGEYKTPNPLNGNSFYLLTKDYRDEVFIDLEKVNKLNENEYIKSQGGKVPLISSETGLLGTPLRQGTDLVVETLFDPRINVGQLVEIQSSFNPLFDGQYKVNGVKHSGTISDAVGGDCKTTLQLYIGNKLLGELKGL
jgi:hypothetical protein